MKKSLYGLLKFFAISYGLALVFGVVLLHIFQTGTTFSQSIKLAVSALTLTGSHFHGQIFQQPANIQFIVLLLIQTGAALWLVFVLQFANLLGQYSLFSNKKQPLSFGQVTVKALTYLFLLEAFSALTIYAFSRNLFQAESSAASFFFAVFHGVSVFTHSGFTLLQHGFANELTSEAYIFQLVLAGIIILGALGYASFFDLTSIKRLRLRMLNPSQNWTKQNRLAIYGTAVCIAAACLIFYMFEAKALLIELKIVAAGITVFFNSIGWFGSGFYAVSPQLYSPAVQWLVIPFLLLGSPSGAFSALGLGVYFCLLSYSGKVKINLYKALAKTALAVLLYSALIISFASSILLIFSSSDSTKEIIFHSVSAFTNTGIAINLSQTDHPVFYILMLAGRIGIPVVATIFIARFKKENAAKEPEQQVMLI